MYCGAVLVSVFVGANNVPVSPLWKVLACWPLAQAWNRAWYFATREPSWPQSGRAALIEQ